MRRWLADLEARLKERQARNARRLAVKNHQTPGHSCVTTKGATMTSKVIALADAENAALAAEVAEGLALVADLQTGLVDALAEVERLRGGREIEQTMLRNVLPTLADNAAENEALRAEVASLRAFQMEPRAVPDAPSLEPCPDSCGGQSWSCVPTPGFGRRWRCDTCGQIVSRHINDALQAADDRRSL